MSSGKCEAHQMSDRMGCRRCDQSWDMNDPSPPECLPFTPADRLRRAADLFESRNAVYGSNYQRQGEALLALFPPGGIPAITTLAEANRLHVYVACVTKLMRYAHNFKSGHLDSARDLQVYAAFLEEMTDHE